MCHFHKKNSITRHRHFYESSQNEKMFSDLKKFDVFATTKFGVKYMK